MGKLCRDRKDTEKRYGKLVAGWVHLSREECAFQTRCDRVVGHVFSTALKWQRELALEYGKSVESRMMESKTLRLTFRPNEGKGKTGWTAGRERRGR